MSNDRLRKSMVAAIVLAAVLGYLVPAVSLSFHDSTQRVGSRGVEVEELQGRLQYLGYYKGNVDGIYGWLTFGAVKSFQRNFGLRAVDGVAGPRTKQMLLKATPQWNWGMVARRGSRAAAARFSSQDWRLLAQTVHGEARGEPYIGQVAVAAVVLNRLEHPSFPNSVSGVIFQPGAFTAVDDGQIWLEPNATSYKAVQDAINGWDPSGDALYYFNPDTATSKWIWTRPQIKKIGRHIFCK